MQKINLLLAIIILNVSCTNNTNKPKMPVNIIGLASPVRLLPEKTEIVLADYIINYDKIDSVKVHHSLSSKLSEIGRASCRERV